VISVVVIAFALLVWVIDPTLHGARFVVLVIALVVTASSDEDCESMAFRSFRLTIA
jgi:hypothetical protein